MDIILNYIFIGAIFTFMVDCIIILKRKDLRIISILDHWDNNTRIACVLIWPLGMLVFLISFIKTIFKK